MVLSLKYIEDELSFDFSDEVNTKVGRIGDWFFFALIELLISNVPIGEELEEVEFVCGVIDNIFFKIEFEKLTDDFVEHYMFYDFNIITSDEYLDSINSNKYLRNGTDN